MRENCYFNEYKSHKYGTARELFFIKFWINFKLKIHYNTRSFFKAIYDIICTMGKQVFFGQYNWTNFNS